MLQFLLSFIIFFTIPLDASVEHKDEFIDVYLSNISSNMSEKTELLEHIEKNKDGVFIDIGTGGDAVAIIATQLPKSSRATLIAADIDPLVINSIKTRRPEISEFINSISGPKVDLITMSATNMGRIKDNTIAGIGASALAHEIYSYTPNKEPLDQFVSEVCRVLEKEGVFVYRDPKWVEDPSTRCIMIVKKDIAKYYISLFLPKFLDRKFTAIRDYREECCKPMLYNHSDVKINAYLVNTCQCRQMSFDEFLNTNFTSIDFAKNFSIEAPKGLIAEIQRHYLMFLRDYFAAGFVDESHFKSDLNINDLSKEEREVILTFATRKELTMSNHVLKKETFPVLFNEATKLKQLFSEGFKVNITKNKDLLEYISKLNFEDIDRNQLYLIDKETLFIDPKILILLFHGKEKGIFKFLANDENLALDLLEHLKLEGEEHYFYKTRDELITYLGQYSRFILKDTHKKNYMLAPIDVEYIKEAPRDYYRSILNRDMIVIDQHGNIQEPVTEKNIIHFKLQSEQKAFEIYKSMLKSQPDKYPTLLKWMSHVERSNP